MNEQEYMTAQELTRVRIAIDILGDIIPENSETITKEQKQEIMEPLHQWLDRLWKANKIR